MSNTASYYGMVMAQTIALSVAIWLIDFDSDIIFKISSESEFLEIFTKRCTMCYIRSKILSSF